MKKRVLLGLLLFPLAAAQQATTQEVRLRLMETTDIHTNIVPYDYYQDAETDALGLAKTATLIKAARKEAPNTLLFDNGDLIQGTPLGDYKARVDVLESGEIHPVYQAMNLMGYDAANIGNHEFNYGLGFLETALSGADFPYVNANVYGAGGKENYFEPYVILEREVTDEAGETHTLNVGVIGFVPPQIMTWDKSNLQGKVVAKDIVETAEKFVPEMREAGADIVVAVPHSGFEAGERQGMDENAVLYLSEVEGIDAIMFGHAHSIFPSEQFEDYPGADLEAGTINGVPSVMPGFLGRPSGCHRPDPDAHGGRLDGNELSERSPPHLRRGERNVARGRRPGNSRGRHRSARGNAGVYSQRGRRNPSAYHLVFRPSFRRPLGADRQSGANLVHGKSCTGYRIRRSANFVGGGTLQGRGARRGRLLHEHPRREAGDQKRRRPVHLSEHAQGRQAYGVRRLGRGSSAPPVSSIRLRRAIPTSPS